jgi:type II secretory pathway pseudopilin PulG
MRTRNHAPRSERGITLVEMLIAILVMTTGILALGRMIPAATRGQQSDKILKQANAYAQQKVESLQTAYWSDPLLTDGRHPASGADSLGSGGQWQRYHEVVTMAAPLDNLRKVTVTVDWNYLGPHSVTATTYMRR